MKNLFIDTNILLSLYHFSDDDIKEFEKLIDHIDNDIQLILTEQVKSELLRNRENKLNDSFSKMKMNSISYPAFSRAYPEYYQIKEGYDNVTKLFDDWKEKMQKDIQEHNLPADEVIRKLFKKAKIYQSNDLLELAVERKRLGNPPGKGEGYGDGINWECLLKNVPNGEDLYFISADRDFQSLFSCEQFHPVLKKEWETKKESKIYYYNSLKSFLFENVKEINLKYENEKNELIDKLSQSMSFRDTHNIISQLNNYDGWSKEQISKLIDILDNNSQVSSIFSDEDVECFYKNIFNR